MTRDLRQVAATGHMWRPRMENLCPLTAHAEGSGEDDTMFSKTRTATLGLLVGAALVFGSGVASAQSSPQTASITVTATVVNSCTITGATIAFTSYNPLSASNVTADASLGVRCTKGATPRLTLNGGTGGDWTMAGPDGAELPYVLYQNSTHATAWTTSNSQGWTATGLGKTDDVRVYGVIPAGADVPAGSYSDTVTATIVF